jgi:hypothetical protein
MESAKRTESFLGIYNTDLKSWFSMPHSSAIQVHFLANIMAHGSEPRSDE